MAFDAFLKIEKIPGESTDAKHKDEIELIGYEHVIEQEGSARVSTAGGGTSSKCDHGNFGCLKLLDKATPKIAEFCSTGEPVGVCEISLNRSGGDKVEYMNYKLSDVVISEVKVDASYEGNETQEPVEWVWLNYGKIEWTYTQQKRSDGTGGGKIAGGWNCATNEKV